MPGFNSFTRKEDLSLRLRAQNLRNARDQTKRLEEDNRKMEERLKELKTAMRREKEQRERQGAGFWGRGQPSTGSLTKYASEVLLNKTVAPPSERKLKVRLLRDDPVDKPKQSVSLGPPGTMKYIAQRKLTSGATPRDKQRSPRCGQCEDRTATVSCVQCSEIYCPGCFSAFHLKGALKQHRSVPLSAAAGPRVCMSPSTSADSNSPRDAQASGLLPNQSNGDMNGSEAAGASYSSSPPHTSAPTLLQGDYNESQSAASFQAALMAWRQGEQPEVRQLTRQSPEKRIASSALGVDESIGTSEETRVPDIKFTSTLTYAEKLMLKKHLRMKMAGISPEKGIQSTLSFKSNSNPIVTPRSSEEMLLRSSSQLHSPGSFSRENMTADSSRETGSTVRVSNNDSNTKKSASLEEDDHVDFQSLFEAVTLSKSPDKMSDRPGPIWSDISISEMFPKQHLASEIPHQKSSVAYTFKEVSPLESWKTEHLKQSEASVSLVDKCAKPRQQDTNILQDLNKESRTDMYNPAKAAGRSSLSLSQSQKEHKSYPTTQELPDNGSRLPSNSESMKQKSESSEYQHKIGLNDTETIQSPVSLKTKSPKALSRPKSRPKSAKLKMTKFNCHSPGAGHKGHLTKAPSEALRMVAQMFQSPGYSYATHSPLEDFFLLGVEEKQSMQTEDRVVTPFKRKNKTPRPASRSEGTKSARHEKVAAKISNRLYQMAPRSWYPDNSLSTTHQNGENPDEQEREIIMSYSYSKQQTSGHGIEWYPRSSQNIKDSPPSLSVYGDMTDAAEFNSQEVSVQRSSNLGQEDTHSETSGNYEQFQQTNSPETSRQTLRRRFHNVTVPASTSDIHKSFTKLPVPPDSKKGHRLSPEISSLSFPTRSNINSNITSSDQNGFKLLAQDVKSRTSKDKENLKLFITSNTSQTVADSLKNSVTSVSQHSGPGTICPKRGQIAAVHHDGQNSKLEASQHKQSLNNFNRELKEVLSPRKSDKRPNSSTTVPAALSTQELQKSAKILRPNSSSGSKEPLRKTQPCPSSDGDTVVSALMKSRVQEDGWIDGDNDVSYDYDDGDDLTRVCLLMKHKKLAPTLNYNNSDNWQTEIRPFSGLSIDSRTSNPRNRVTSANGEHTSRPSSYRSQSALSQKSGRISRAIVVDGDDLSCYDSVGTPDEQNLQDKQALEQLDWELASNTGRLTADGKISRMSILKIDDDDVSSQPMMRPLKMRSDREYDVATRLLEDEKQAERKIENLELKKSMTIDDIDEVRALR